MLTPVEILSSADIDSCRRLIGRAKLDIRLQYDLRRIVTLMVIHGEEYWRSRDGEWNFKPKFKFPVNDQHAKMIAELRPYNSRLAIGRPASFQVRR